MRWSICVVHKVSWRYINFKYYSLMGLMTPAWYSIITRWRRTHQSWVRVAPSSDNTSVITRSHTAYVVLCDTSIIVNISYNKNQWQRLNIVTARLCLSSTYIFYYDMIWKNKSWSVYSYIINRNHTIYLTGSWAWSSIKLLVSVDCMFCVFLCLCVSVFSR